jgi:hypothetical protein
MNQSEYLTIAREEEPEGDAISRDKFIRPEDLYRTRSAAFQNTFQTYYTVALPGRIDNLAGGFVDKSVGRTAR